MFSEKIANALQNGEVAVIPTDTIYGIVASASQRAAVERVYTIKGRSPQKPCIILLATPQEMSAFGVSAFYIAAVSAHPTQGPTSFIVPIERTDIQYLDRGTGTLAFRIPTNQALHELLTRSGSLIAPSANPEGMSPATTISQAKDYFGEVVDHYVDGGTIVGSPSVLIDIRTGERLR